MNGAMEALFDDLRARHEEPAVEIARYTKRAVEDYVALPHGARTAWEIVRAFDLAPLIDDDHNDTPLYLALADIGIRFARIVREPAYRIDAKKAARDAELGRPTMHLAPQWRHPLGRSGQLPEEQGTPALIVPVAACGRSSSELLSFLRFGDDGFLENIADLIAIPLDGGRPLSLTGYTVTVGGFAADDRGRLTVYGGGKAWLDAYLAQIRALVAETPPHLVEQLHMPFPHPAASLLVEPRAIEWRLWRFDCAVPEAVREIVCPDSRKLAELIDASMRKKDPRPMPKVLAPSVQPERRAA